MLLNMTEQRIHLTAPYCTAYLFCSFGDAIQYLCVVRILKPNFKQRLDAKCVSLANAISWESWTALKGTSGWRASLMLSRVSSREGLVLWHLVGDDSAWN